MGAPAAVPVPALFRFRPTGPSRPQKPIQDTSLIRPPSKTTPFAYPGPAPEPPASRDGPAPVETNPPMPRSRRSELASSCFGCHGSTLSALVLLSRSRSGVASWARSPSRSALSVMVPLSSPSGHALPRRRPE
ncbi:hypothetical protein J0S82_009124 [Galemys pyrenaicus]|uniref:Uncharacterized protein n=1 Tax=Galemys pyrenaicus TaxID=202257 RepID=A0A8J6AE63_GALPY|nr:hypothetical protein J0S82_009124 [Galemys pyrenaicus]